ncbi:MAG TPA: DUF2255 family protein [Candidatus Limnocylindrales bacterium]
MPFAPAELALLSEAVEIEIETRAAADAPLHRTIIWVVTDGPDAFVRSVRGSMARWYREAVAHPGVVVHAAGRSLRARAVPAPEADAVARTSAALERKYTGADGLAEMLVPDTFPTTMRLEPV